jgi:DNA processing protein
VEFFGSVDKVFEATLTELEAAGLPAAAAQSLGTGRSIELANDEVAKAASNGVQLITIDDTAYPARLRQIYDPAIVLYVRGNVAALSQPGTAVIGTRHPTPYGTGMAERLACDLATRGVVIFSGLARGVDTAAHRGAMSGKDKTVAVFGTGVDVVYPKENSRLADQILSLGGALDFRVSTQHVRRAPELSHSQSHHQRNLVWRACRRSC